MSTLSNEISSTHSNHINYINYINYNQDMYHHVPKKLSRACPSKRTKDVTLIASFTLCLNTKVCTLQNSNSNSFQPVILSALLYQPIHSVRKMKTSRSDYKAPMRISKNNSAYNIGPLVYPLGCSSLIHPSECMLCGWPHPPEMFKSLMRRSACEMKKYGIHGWSKAFRPI